MHQEGELQVELVEASGPVAIEAVTVDEAADVVGPAVERTKMKRRNGNR